MEFFDLSLKGVKIILPKKYSDKRGYFLETYRKELFAEEGLPEMVQENHSFSTQNSLRGMHFQSEPGQAKLVSVSEGRIYDVVVDLREESPTYMCWQGVYLDDEDHKMLYIPRGFAHGFCVLSEHAHVHYKVSSYYHSESERTFRYDDPEIGISWPIKHPILSERDISAPTFRAAMSIS